MSVKEHSVVDIVYHDPKTDEVVLSMVEERDWGQNGELLPDLQEKMNTYLVYVLEGQLEEQYPQMKKKKVRLRLHSSSPPGQKERQFIDLIVEQVLAPQSIGWEESLLA